MSRVTTTVLATVLCLAHATEDCAAKRPSRLALRLETFSDAAMTEPATVFGPGTVIYYRLTARAPSDAEGKAARVNVVAKASIAGIGIPYSFKTAFRLPLTNPMDAQQPLGFDGTEQSRVGKIDVPAFMPDATLEVKAVVRVAGAGTVSVRNALTVER